MTVKTTFLVLLMTGIGLLAQTSSPPAPAGDTNNDAALRRALRTIPVRTNTATVQPAVVPAPPAAVTPAAVAAAEEAEAPGEGEAPPTAPAANVTPVPAAPAAPTVPPAPAQQAGQTPAPQNAPAPPEPKPEEVIPAGQINFSAAELNQVLTLYADLVNRTILRAPNLASPPIVLKTQTPLTKREAIQALDAVFALNGIALINIGEKFVKVVPAAQAEQEGQKPSTVGAGDLPEMGQYVTHILQLKTAKPSELVPVLQAFSKTKNVLPVDSSQMLVIRDYTENLKRMLEIIDSIDVPTSSEFVSEVIPIKYALAGEIASALNSLSGGGGGTTVGGGAATAPRTAPARTGLQQPGQPQAGVPTPAGAPSSTASFSSRLAAIVRRASSSGDVQILGQTKIIADERTNSLLIFASRQDMTMIKDIVGKLDVVLAQVLIEAIIMEVSLTGQRDLGFSYIQNRSVHHGYLSGAAGAINNGAFLTPGSFVGALTNAAPGGFSYAASFGNDFTATLTAIESDGRIKVLSRPRIQTSHAVPAQLFIGNTVPYITGSTYGDFSGATSRSVYQEKRVGITLDVLPLINPDGLVVMDISQVIQQLGAPTQIDGNDVPTTSERTATAKVAVKDGDTIVLGGFISNSKGKSDSGVPFLKDIPLLGYLFRSTTHSEDRVELIVMMRPTVLPTPEAAAVQANVEKKRIPAFEEMERDEQKRAKKATARADKKYGIE